MLTYSRLLTSFHAATRSSFWRFCADIYPVLIAATLPWSTTAVAAFNFIWLIVLAPTIELRAFSRSLSTPAYWLPIAFFALGVLGLLWADSTWQASVAGLSPLAKLLMIPFLLYHFERSPRGHWVFIAFLSSCIALLIVSWATFLLPELLHMTKAATLGVPVRNSIDQSQEFVLCSFTLIPLVLLLIQQQRFGLAAIAATVILLFLANLFFVVSARTALVCLPILVLLFTLRYLSYRASALLIAVAVSAALLAWFASPYLQQRVGSVAEDYREYKESHGASSTGRRLEWWMKSFEFIGGAPLFGNGTGSTRQLFNRDAADQPGDWGKMIGNPHNQTLYVAVQWGLSGVIILYAMWGTHLLLFRDPSYVAWIGLVVVVQNFVSSIFNSHLFDFAEGWMYVLGVGVAGGMVRATSPPYKI